MEARNLGSSAAWTAVYVLAVLLGRQTALPESGLSLFWPAAGVAALWILLSSSSAISLDVALLFSATVIANQVAGVALGPALIFGVANVLVGLAVRVVVLRLPGRDGGEVDVGSVRGVLALAAASIAAGVVSAPPGALAGHLLSGTWTPVGSLAWVVRNAAGVFVVAGAVLAVVVARRTRVPGTPWTCCLSHEPRSHVVGELALTAVGSGVTLALVFGWGQATPVAFIPLVVSAFVGFRFAPVVAAAHALAAGVVAVVATLADRGPFGLVDDPLLGAMLVQAWVLSQAALALVLSWAIAERQRMTRAMEEARREADERAQLLAAVTENLAHGVVVLDSDGTVLLRNHAAGDVDPGTLSRVAGVAVGLPVETELAVPGGGDRSASVVSVRAEPLDLVGSSPRRVAVVSLQDVTAHRSQVEQLESFAGVVAHDLQNPLAAVTAWAQVLHDTLEQKGVLDSEAQALLDRIDRAGQGMSDLIADLLAYASASSAPLTLASVDLDEVVGTIATELRAVSDKLPIISAQALGTVRADPVLLRQMFANLLGNAVKYARAGTRPHVRVTRSDSAAGVEISVADNGIGIPEHMRSRVFEGFTRVAGEAAARPGTGLGLAICARTMERHHGTIAAGAGPGGTGTTITARFPHDPSRVTGVPTAGAAAD